MTSIAMSVAAAARAAIRIRRIDMHRNGMSIMDIANSEGVSYQAIRQWHKRMKLIPNSTDVSRCNIVSDACARVVKATPADYVLFEMRLSGKTYKEIAIEKQLNKNSVRSSIRRVREALTFYLTPKADAVVVRHLRNRVGSSMDAVGEALWTEYYSKMELVSIPKSIRRVMSLSNKRRSLTIGYYYLNRMLLAPEPLVVCDEDVWRLSLRGRYMSNEV